MIDEVPACSCTESGCDGEDYDDPDDPRTCRFCLALEGEMPCPADPAAYTPEVEHLMDLVKDYGFEPVVVCADGSEPFASLDVGHGLSLDLTAKVRRRQ